MWIIWMYSSNTLKPICIRVVLPLAITGRLYVTATKPERQSFTAFALMPRLSGCVAT